MHRVCIRPLQIRRLGSTPLAVGFVNGQLALLPIGVCVALVSQWADCLMLHILNRAVLHTQGFLISGFLV